MSPSRTIRIAVVGTGVWAQKIHYPTLAHLREQPFALHGICSLDQPIARELADRYGFARVYRDLDELIADREIEAVAVIVMPRALPALLQRLQAMGVPLLTEKPPGADSTQAAELVRMITVPHVVAFNRRFVPLVTRLRDEVRLLDAPSLAEGRFYRHGRLDPDFIRGTGIHLINAMEFVFGPMVRARTVRLRHPSAPTWSWLTEAEFSSGLTARLHFLPCTGMQVEQIEVHSAARSLLLEIPAIGEPSGALRIFTTKDGDAAAPVDPAALPPVGSANGYQTLFNSTERTMETPPAGEEPLRTCGFVGAYEELAAVVRGGASRSTFHDALATMRVADAIEDAVDFHAS
ncbi:MAG TPA: Gfo/Idh/MocA family oxidoreductase [Opitutus sp.]|nr:Gfo/Idh/MocA family oxidoreductase [Opitutus sp.]